MSLFFIRKLVLLEKNMSNFIAIMQVKMQNQPTQDRTRDTQNYGSTTSVKSSKCPMWENRRKRETSRKYVLPSTEMNFSLLSVIFLFTLSVLPITLSDSFNKHKPSNLHEQNYAIGKSIPRKP